MAATKEYERIEARAAYERERKNRYDRKLNYGAHLAKDAASTRTSRFPDTGIEDTGGSYGVPIEKFDFTEKKDTLERLLGDLESAVINSQDESENDDLKPS